MPNAHSLREDSAFPGAALGSQPAPPVARSRLYGYCTEVAPGAFALRAQKILDGVEIYVRGRKRGRKAAGAKKRSQMQGAGDKHVPCSRVRPARLSGTQRWVGVVLGGAWSVRWAGLCGRAVERAAELALGVWPVVLKYKRRQRQRENRE